MKNAWSISEVATMLGLPVDATRALVAQVFEGQRDLLTFQDLTVLRSAAKANLDRAAVGRIAREQPTELPLTTVTVQKLGREHVAHSGASRWNAKTGQQLLDFAPARSPWLTAARPRRDAHELFSSAVALEEADPLAAIDAYVEAVAADPRHADAHINLGRLLHQHGRLREAEAHYVAALVSRPSDTTACFNLAVVLEDLGKLDEAIARYRETIDLDPSLVDAYFNLSRLYEKKGEKVAAIRHLKDYRRLTNSR
ncbi:MAG: tetratricopeptide repeat protein [Myxococcaceae bacterium]